MSSQVMISDYYYLHFLANQIKWQNTLKLQTFGSRIVIQYFFDARILHIFQCCNILHHYIESGSIYSSPTRIKQQLLGCVIIHAHPVYEGICLFTPMIVLYDRVDINS